MAFKIDFDGGDVLAWSADSDSGVSVSRDTSFTPSVYVGTTDRDTAKLDALDLALGPDPKVVTTSFEQHYTSLRDDDRSTVLRVDLERMDDIDPFAREIRHHHEGGTHRPGTFELYNTDFAPQFRYCLEEGISPVPERDLDIMRIAMPDWAIADRDLEPLTCDGEQLAPNDMGQILALEATIKQRDPDVLQLSSAQILPLLHEVAESINLDPPTLGRRPGLDQLAGESTFESYGRVGHSAARYDVPGRVIVDESNSFLLAKSGMAGLLDLVERSHRPLQETAWGSIGTVLTAIQIREALDRDVLIPATKTQHEFWKSARTLHDADRGGFTFDPEVGLFEDVYELDFASLYPNIMITRNVSPETVRCECHQEREDVPGLGYSICDERGFIPDVLEPIVTDRAAIKEAIAEADNSDRIEELEARSDALKWILVCCFGYQGYENSKFGRIEAHEAINAHAREILLTAKDHFEAGGWRIVHGIVDSIWVEPMLGEEQRPIRDVAADISDAFEINLEYEHHYDWICFVPRRESEAGALTKYFGWDGEADEWKVRGVECRQRSTPAFVENVQRELMEILGERRAAEPVVERCRRYIRDLEGGEVDPSDLVIRKRVSKPLEAYQQETQTVAALRRYRDEGMPRHPGQDVRYVVTDDDARRSADRVRLDFESCPDYDASFYVEELIRACESVVSPLGWDREDIRRYYRDHRNSGLSAYG